MEELGNQESGFQKQQAYRIAYLVAGFIRKDLSPAERDELDVWILEKDENLHLFEHLTDDTEIAKTLAWFQQLDTEKKLKESKKDPRFLQPEVEKQTVYWPYWMAAAALICLIAFWWLKPDTKHQKAPEIAQKKAAEILPGSNQAVLVLENGDQIALNETMKDTVLELGVQVRRTAGELIYAASKEGLNIEIHQLIVPRKGMYKAVLPDGSRVWLNSESSLRYPNRFAEKERRVTLTGEGYFEVNTDSTRPFIVQTGEEETIVLGTRFTISAYESEKHSTSLLEGKVRLQKRGISQILFPGQQAIFAGDEWQVKKFDQEQELAWINHQFIFRNTPVKEVMNELARWYDIEPEFKDTLNFHLNATIPRHTPLTKLLSVLEKTGHGHYRLEGRIILITR
jgi:ferric-dicitrate binding protein FerR (iron transport regulator)